MPARRIAAACAGLALLLTAWVLSSPPNSSPDEVAHLLRAVSAAQGQERGGDPPASRADNLFAANRRVFMPPSRFQLVDTAPCFAFKSDVAAACSPRFTSEAGVVTSHVGTYYPLMYVPLGAAALLGRSPAAGIYAMRVVSSAVCLGLLIGALALAQTGWQRIGWFMATGPLTVYAASSASTNGMEVAASIAFVTAGLAFGRRGSGMLWLASGVVLASCKSLGPIFVAIDALAVAGVNPGAWRKMLGRWRASAFIALAAAANLVWSAVANRTASSGISLRDALMQAVHSIGTRSFFSMYGWLDVTVPKHVADLGRLAFAVIVLVALVFLGSWRARLTLAGLLGAAALVTIGVTAIELQGGFTFQARYTLALVAAIPIVAAYQLRGFVPLQWILLACMTAVGGVSLFENARRYAVGLDGPVAFFRRAAWTPPGSWVIPIAAGVVGLSLLLLAVLPPARLRPSSPLAAA